MMWRAICLILLCIFIGCGPKEVRLTRSLKRTIDTTASKRLVILRPQLDSMCDAQYDSLFKAAVDSIVQVRELEIQRIVDQ